jgi:site-specific recombinase XerD
MGQPVIQGADSSVGDTIRTNLPWFQRHLRSGNKTPSTVETYGKAVEQLADFLDAKGMPTHVGKIRREHVESFLVDLQDRGWRPATVAQRFRSLQQFFKWLDDEGDVPGSPMAKMHAPIVPVEPPEVLRAEDRERLLKVTSGRDFDDRRDNAILRLLFDTGMRRGELAGLKVGDLDIEGDSALDVAYVVGKGRRPRACPFTDETATALRRYLKVRAQHPHAALEWLWLGKKGRLTDNGVLQMVRRRGRQAGLEHVYVHLFRHSFAHEMLVSGMQEGDLMRLAGWKSRQMLGRYGASAADERAREAYRRLKAGGR